jgi:hypothetical protein
MLPSICTLTACLWRFHDTEGALAERLGEDEVE